MGIFLLRKARARAWGSPHVFIYLRVLYGRRMRDPATILPCTFAKVAFLFLGFHHPRPVINAKCCITAKCCVPHCALDRPFTPPAALYSPKSGALGEGCWQAGPPGMWAQECGTLQNRLCGMRSTPIVCTSMVPKGRRRTRQYAGEDMSPSFHTWRKVLAGRCMKWGGGREGGSKRQVPQVPWPYQSLLRDADRLVLFFHGPAAALCPPWVRTCRSRASLTSGLLTSVEHAFPPGEDPGNADAGVPEAA
eukprot:98195-Pelagomonas_calceolata.AAC.8